MSKILITGGGGFVGTQVAWNLTDAGHDVTIVDRKHPVHYFTGVYRIADYLEFLKNTDEKFDIIVHLAAEHLVEQSVTEPAKYYENNVVKMKAMLDLMVERGIKNIVFSSSGNTYGRQGAQGLLSEGLFYDPENPYASTKVAGEMMIKDYARAYGMNYVVFRYFNAAGADPDARFGYVQTPATHVIPIICRKIQNNKPFTIHGTDYPTPDGTCVRDYVHVSDLARAHEKAVDLLNTPGRANHVFNLGGGHGGVSVRNLIDRAGYLIGVEPTIIEGPRRNGDPAMLVADINKAWDILHWAPHYNIDEMILHAWNWEKKVNGVI